MHFLWKIVGLKIQPFKVFVKSHVYIILRQAGLFLWHHKQAGWRYFIQICIYLCVINNTGCNYWWPIFEFCREIDSEALNNFLQKLWKKTLENLLRARFVFKEVWKKWQVKLSWTDLDKKSQFWQLLLVLFDHQWHIMRGTDKSHKHN